MQLRLLRHFKHRKKLKILYLALLDSFTTLLNYVILSRHDYQTTILQRLRFKDQCLTNAPIDRYTGNISTLPNAYYHYNSACSY